jgi:hypothetical protein
VTVSKIAWLEIYKQGQHPEDQTDEAPSEEERFRSHHIDAQGALVEQTGLAFEDMQEGETFAHWPGRTITFEESGDARELGYRLLPQLMFAVLAFLVVAFAYSLILHLQVLDKWLDRPFLGVFPAIGLVACAGLLVSARRGSDRLPFAMATLLFVAAFATMACSFLPYMVPFSITIAEAAAPSSSLSFLFWGAGMIVLPITLLYTMAVYLVFRGKAAPPDELLVPSAGMDQ